MLRNWRLYGLTFLSMIALIYFAIFYSWKIILAALSCMLIIHWLWRYPAPGISLSVFLAGLGVLSFFEIGVMHIKAYQIVMLLTFCTLVLKSLWRKSTLYLPRSLFYAVGFLIFSLILSFVNASFPAVFVKQFFLLTVYMLFFVTIINVVRTPAHLRVVKTAIIFSGALACLYSFLVILHVAPALGGASLYHFARPQSFFAEPNEFGVFLVFVSGFIFSTWLGAQSLVQKIAAGVVIAMIIANIIPNMSRGSWIGFVISLAVTMLALHSANIKKISVLRIAGAGVILCFILLISFEVVLKFIPSRSALSVKEIIQERAVSLFQRKDPTRDIRYNTNKVAIEAFLEHPFVGWGLGNTFVILEKKYKYKDASPYEVPKVIAATSSNFISDVAMETGLVGLAAFFTFIFLVLKSGWQTIKGAMDRPTLLLYAGAYASFIGMLINSLTYATIMLPFFWIVAGFLCTDAGRLENTHESFS